MEDPSLNKAARLREDRETQTEKQVGNVVFNNQ